MSSWGTIPEGYKHFPNLQKHAQIAQHVNGVRICEF